MLILPQLTFGSQLKIPFSTVLYPGTGSTQTITTNLDQDLVWIKQRDFATQDHYLNDTERGSLKYLRSNLTDAEATANAPVSAFNSDGFDLAVTSLGNNGAANYVAWSFRKDPGFFDIQSITSPPSGIITVNHSLGTVPGCIIYKRLNVSEDWFVYHRSLNGGSTPEDYYVNLNNNSPEVSNTAVWNSYAPTSSDFQLGNLNDPGTYIAYIFGHETATNGRIKCTGFTTAGSANDVVTLGWKPQFLMIRKVNDTTNNWFLLDAARSNFGRDLFADKPQAEGTFSFIEITNTGFIWKGDAGTGREYIVVAIREGVSG